MLKHKKKMPRNEMASFQKKKEIIRYISVDSLGFDQESSLTTKHHTLFSSLVDKRSFILISSNNVSLAQYYSSSGQQLMHMAITLSMGFKFCHEKHFCVVNPRIQENIEYIFSVNRNNYSIFYSQISVGHLG